MKVPIGEFTLVDLDAPVLPAYETVINGVTHWMVWCKFCKKWHRHGAAEGHREAHCQDSASDYWKQGYNLAYAGEWKKGAGTDFLLVLDWLGWDRRFWVRVVEFVTIWAIWHFRKGIYHGNGLPKRDGKINAVGGSTAEV